jgi:hypothetical protein
MRFFLAAIVALLASAQLASAQLNTTVGPTTKLASKQKKICSVLDYGGKVCRCIHWVTSRVLLDDTNYRSAVRTLVRPSSAPSQYVHPPGSHVADMLLRFAYRAV